MRNILAEADYHNLIIRVFDAVKNAFETYKENYNSRFILARLDASSKYPSLEEVTQDQVDKVSIDQYADRFWDFYFVYDRENQKVYKIHDAFLRRNLYESLCSDSNKA